jgi:hypothetical protein
MISDVTIEIQNQKGANMFRGWFANVTDDPNHTKYRLLSDALNNNEMYSNKGHIGERLKKYTDGTYQIEILCRLSTGELLSVYKGTLTE